MKKIDVLNVSVNKPKADWMDYRYVVHGVGKSGKSTLIYNLTKEKFNGDLSKLLLCAFERGYSALNGVHAMDIDAWEDFTELVKQLVEHKDEVSYKMVAIDTVDIAQNYATDYVLKKASVTDKKRYKAISDIPWGKGYQLLEKAMSEQFDKLDKAGYSLFFITHNKDKKFESRDGVSYDKTTVSLTGRVRDLIINMVDFICYIDIAKERQGENLVDKRYIYFRGNADLEAGSRFADVPEKIEYDARSFIDTVESAILSEYDGDEKEMIKAKEEQAIENEEKVKEFIQKAKETGTVEDCVKYLDDNIGNLKKADRTKLQKEFEAILGDFNYRNSDDLEGLEKCVELVKGLLSG